MGKENYTNIILEDINSKFDRVLEIVQGLPEQLAQKADKADIENLNQQLTIIEFSLEQIVPKIGTHEKRLEKLEFRIKPSSTH